MLGAAVLWSLSGSLIKVLNSHGGGVPSLTIACYRSLLAGLALTPLALRQREGLRQERLSWKAASVIAFTLMTSCFVVATARTAAASVIVLQYTAPVWVFALSPFLLREKPAPAEALALLLSLAGVTVVFLGNPASDAPALELAALSGASYGALTVILRRLRRSSPVALMWMNGLWSGLLVLPFVIAGGVWRISPAALPLLAAVAVFQFALPYLLFSFGLRTVQAHRASLLSLIEAGLNPLWALLLLGERTPPATLAGGPLIMAGVIAWLVLVWRRERTARQEAPALEPPPME